MGSAVPIVAQYRILAAAAAAALALCLAAAPALAAEDKSCLACHGQEGMSKSFEKGDPVSLHVDGRAFAASPGGGSPPTGASGRTSAVIPRRMLPNRLTGTMTST